MTVESDKALNPLRWHKDSDSVFALLREIAYASMRRDTAFFERVLDDDFVGVGPDGENRNKAEQIAELQRLDSIKKFEFDDLRVSGNDDMAFATFLATVHYQANGQDSTAQFRYTINFIKKDDVTFKHTVDIVRVQGSCLKCHTNEGLWKAPIVKVKEIAMKGLDKEIAMAVLKGKKPVEIELIPDEAQSPFKHADVILLHQQQLKIAAIHMSRKQ